MVEVRPCSDPPRWGPWIAAPPLLFSTWHLLPPHPQGCSKELFCIKHATGVGVQVCWPQGGGGKVPGDPYCSQAKGVFSAPPGPEFFMQ